MENAFAVLIEKAVVTAKERASWLVQLELLHPSQLRQFTLDGAHTWLLVATGDDYSEDLAGALAALSARRLGRRTWAISACEDEVLEVEAFDARGKRRWHTVTADDDEPTPGAQRRVKALLSSLGVRVTAAAWMTSPWWRMMKELKTSRASKTPRVNLKAGDSLLEPRGPGWREIENEGSPEPTPDSVFESQRAYVEAVRAGRVAEYQAQFLGPAKG